MNSKRSKEMMRIFGRSPSRTSRTGIGLKRLSTLVFAQVSSALTGKSSENNKIVRKAMSEEVEEKNIFGAVATPL